LVKWTEYLEQGYKCIKGENESISVHIIPGRGSKIISLIDKRTGRDWVHQTDRPWEPLHYDMDWDEGDRGGWDEMFPTIEACTCPNEPWQDLCFPDHGEVWCLPWSYELAGERMRFMVKGVQIPYCLTKEIILEENELRVQYQLDNPTPFVFSYLWAAHPLLRISQGMRLITAPSEGAIQIAYSHHQRLGAPLEYSQYPIANTLTGECIDLSVVENELSHSAEKYYFTDPINEGYAGLEDPATGERIVFRFSPDENPYLAVWAHYGGLNDYTMAFEPASGYMDSVQRAHDLGKVMQVQGHSTVRWTLRVTIESNNTR